MTQGPHHRPDAPKAKALALALQGHSNCSISELIGIPERTVCRWVNRGREAANGNKPIMEGWAKLTLQAQDLLEDGVDSIEEEGSALKHLTQLTVLAGVGTDKLQKEHTPTSIQADKVLIILNAERPVIEGEVVKEIDG